MKRVSIDRILQLYNYHLTYTFHFLKDMKTTVERLIEQEMRRMKRKERSELPLSIDLFEKDDLLKQELQRVQKKEPLDILDTERYELKGPADENQVEGWKSAVNNTKSQLESQAGR